MYSLDSIELAQSGMYVWVQRKCELDPTVQRLVYAQQHQRIDRDHAEHYEKSDGRAVCHSILVLVSKRASDSHCTHVSKHVAYNEKLRLAISREERDAGYPTLIQFIVYESRLSSEEMRVLR